MPARLPSQLLLSRLRCLDSGSTLRIAPEEICLRLDQQVGSGKLTDQTGLLVTRRIESGLINDEASRFYPIWDGIPQLVWEESIPLLTEDNHDE